VAIGDPEAPFGLDKLETYRPLYNIQTMSDVGTDLAEGRRGVRPFGDLPGRRVGLCGLSA
jgi:hypothetical protein